MYPRWLQPAERVSFRLKSQSTTFGRCKTPELVKELKSQPTINDQFAILYNKFDYTLDISDSLPGPDENKDGIEAFINALEVSEPVRNALKQNARYIQKTYITTGVRRLKLILTKPWR